MINKIIIRGYKPLCYIDVNVLLMSKSNVLFTYDIAKKSFTKLATHRISIWYIFISYFPLLRRLLRIEFRYALNSDQAKYLLVFRNSVLILDIVNKTIEEQKISERGLSFTKISGVKGFEDMICFGDYRENFSKQEISINGFINNQWKKIYTFKKGEIEHVHAIIPDPVNSRVWILTGDFGESACIWLAEENFSKVMPIVRGSQMFRSCVAFPLDGGLLYATDSQMDENFINFLQPNKFGAFDIKIICSINGPCIYGTRLLDDFIFSTTVEPYNGLKKWEIIKGLLGNIPGKGIKKPFAEIIKLNKRFEVEKLCSNAKDVYPFIFQFGTITFPTDNYNNENFVFYNIGLKHNRDCTEIWSLKN